ncbi:MAG: Guanylate kinase [Elusimicrobia bacterium]|nr:Guanylate kinase [Elusimicrobiota bacterium]
MKPNGIPVVISAPSGAGKSTIAAQLVKQCPLATVSTSCTTRSPRPGEKDGIDYFFISIDEFKQKIEKGEFLEWAEVHGHRYGTPISSLEKNLESGKDVVLTIDPQGALSIKKIYPNGVFIFVVPPTWETLVNRLTKRATDDKATLEIRVANARKELTYLSHYDYLVVNDHLETAVRTVVSIVEAEHHKLSRIDKKSIPIFNHG